MTAAQVPVRLEHLPGCPLVDRVRALLQQAMARTGVAAVIEDVEGPYPSPTLLVDGVDVVTGQPAVVGEMRCRLDLPTYEQITAALTRENNR